MVAKETILRGQSVLRMGACHIRRSSSPTKIAVEQGSKIEAGILDWDGFVLQIELLANAKPLEKQTPMVAAFFPKLVNGELNIDLNTELQPGKRHEFLLLECTDKKLSEKFPGTFDTVQFPDDGSDWSIRYEDERIVIVADRTKQPIIDGVQ